MAKAKAAKREPPPDPGSKLTPKRRKLHDRIKTIQASSEVLLSSSQSQAAQAESSGVSSPAPTSTAAEAVGADLSKITWADLGVESDDFEGQTHA